MLHGWRGEKCEQVRLHAAQVDVHACSGALQVLVSFAELHAIDANVSQWLSEMREEGSIEYEARARTPWLMTHINANRPATPLSQCPQGSSELISGKHDEVLISAPTKEAHRWRGSATDTPRGQACEVVDVDPGTNDYVIISATAPTGSKVNFLRGNGNPTLYLDAFLEVASPEAYSASCAHPRAARSRPCPLPACTKGSSSAPVPCRLNPTHRVLWHCR